MKSRFFTYGISILAFASGLSAYSADFSLGCSDIRGSTENCSLTVAIRGEIKRGDFDRFKQFLLQDNALGAYSNHVFLNSLGGDVSEAMRFADFFDKSSAKTIVGPYSKCYSACVLMFAGAAGRTLAPAGELGVHRIVLNSEDFAYAREKAVVLQASEDAYSYLTRQGIPQDIVSKMRETPASEIFVFDFFDVRHRYSSLDNPIYADIVDKRCGKMPSEGKVSPAEAKLDTEQLKRLRGWVICREQLRVNNQREFFRSELAELFRNGKSIAFPNGSLAKAQQAFVKAFAE